MSSSLRRRIPDQQQQLWSATIPVDGDTFPPPEGAPNQLISSCRPPAAEKMTCQDRTNEFISTVKSMQGRHFSNGGGVGVVPAKLKSGRDLVHWNEFTLIAKQIGKDIGNTFSKLEKLTLLAKRKSLFDDKPVEIQELTYIIKQDIGSLNKQIAKLQQLTRNRSYQNGKHMQSHSNSVVISLQSKLASISNEFKQVLEVRTENLKHQKSRRDQFTQGSVSASLPSSAMAGRSAGSVLLADERTSAAEEAQQHRRHYAIDMDENATGGGDSSSTLAFGALQQGTRYQQQMQLIDEQDSYIQSRADTMQNIETTIVELGSIFQQLAHMVKEQEEMVQRIDANVEDTQMNVEAAHSEILKYFQLVTSNRWLMLKIFGILIVFFIVFVVFVA